MVDEQKLRELADQLICHPASRSIEEIESAGEAIKSLLDELQTLRSERTAWRITAENAEKDAARYRWLAGRHWVESETVFRLNLIGTEDSTSYMQELDAAIDAAMKGES